jgi:plasmid stabilization system protein ParE
MGCTIVFSPQAIADLESVVRFIARNNPGAALRVGDALIDRGAILRDFPDLGTKHPKRRGIRKLVSRPYLIFFRYREKRESRGHLALLARLATRNKFGLF